MRISYITITWTQYTPTMRPTGFLIGCRVVKVTPNPSPPSPPSPQGEVTRRHLTLSAFGYSWWACTAANEQSHQTLMCKSNKCAEVQRAAWILIAKPQVSRSQAPPPPPLSLSLSLNQSVHQCACIITASRHCLQKLHRGGKLSLITDLSDIRWRTDQ